MGKIGKGENQELNATKVMALEDGFIEVAFPENRASHYPKDIVLMVKPATVKQIKHWNMQDWENQSAIQMSMRLVDDMLKSNAYLVLGTKRFDSKFLLGNDKLWVIKMIRDVTFDSTTVQPLNWNCQACDEVIDVEEMQNSNWECPTFPYGVENDFSIKSNTSIKFYIPTSVTNEMIFNYAMSQYRRPGATEAKASQMLIEAEQASMLIDPTSWDLRGTAEADKANKKVIEDAKKQFDALTLGDFKIFKEMYDYFKRQDNIVGDCPKCGERITIPSGQLDVRDLFRI